MNFKERKALRTELFKKYGPVGERWEVCYRCKNKVRRKHTRLLPEHSSLSFLVTVCDKCVQ